MANLPTPAQDAAALEVTFDGKYYHFREYRYERLDDAMRYADMQHRKPDYKADPSFVPRWMPEWEPDADQRATMRDLAIDFGAGRFSVGSYRYDRLEDAVAFARLARPSQE